MPGESCAGAVLGTSGVQQAPYGEGHSTVCLSWHPNSGQPLSTGDRLCRHGQTVCVCLHMLCLFCPLWPPPRATCPAAGRANEHPWVGGSARDPGSFCTACLQLFQSKSAVNSLHLSTVSAVTSGLGRWQAGSSRQLGGCEELVPPLPVSNSPSRRCGWALLSLLLLCSWWANRRLGVMGLL